MTKKDILIIMKKLLNFLKLHKNKIVSGAVLLIIITIIYSELADIINKYDEHEVLEGETLTAIATVFNMTVEDLKKINNLESDNIEVGQILKGYSEEYTSKKNRKRINQKLEDLLNGKINNIDGIDVSYAQEDLDIGTIINNNAVDFAMVRMAYFLKFSEVDEIFYKQAKECKETGTLMGAYYWPVCRNIEQAKVEVNKILKAINKIQSEGIYLEMPLAIDIERRVDGGGDLVERILREDKNTIEALKYTADTLQENFYLMLYCNEEVLLKINPILKKHCINLDLWIAKYAYGSKSVMYSDKTLPILKVQTSDSIGIQQVAKTARLKPYLNRDIDKNIANRNYPKIIKDAGKNNLNTRGYKQAYKNLRLTYR